MVPLIEHRDGYRKDLKGKPLDTESPIQVGVEGTISRYKRIIGDTLRSHSRPAQEVETRIAVSILNRMLDRPESVRAA